MKLLTKYHLSLYIVLIVLYVLVQCKKPYSKSQQAIWRLECELGIIADAECPVDGGWSSWSAWSACRGSCDDVGYRLRTRKCTNPPPSKDGMPCNGRDEQTETCFLTSCSVEEYRRLVQGDPSRIEALRQLEAVPALMERCLQIECPFEAVEAALATDNTWQLNSEGLWNSLQCVKHDLGCPVVGEWGVWGMWSACGARCGEGQRWRLRRCDTPPPSDSHLLCSGSPLQSEKCEGDQCAIDINRIEKSAGGSWSEWGEWSQCSSKCGRGVRRRKRSCVEKHVPLNSLVWGTHCRGQHDHLEVCAKRHCSMDGGWSGWGPWGPCSQTCGAGKRSRTRSCTRPRPSGDGTNCIGPKIEIGTCYVVPCEVYYHVVALFNGDSFLQYESARRRSTLFHFYIRFMPLSPHGTVVRRGSVHGPHVRVSLQKWHICLDASGLSQSCNLPRICTPDVLEPAVWHSILITVTTEAALLRVDDARVPIQATFACNPELTNDKINVLIGERLHAEVQDVVLNFMPLILFTEQKSRPSDFYPISAPNVGYEKASKEEAYLNLDNDQFLYLPCFEKQSDWRLELTLKSRRETGIILLLRDSQSETMLYMCLQNMRLKIKLIVAEFKTESSSTTEWLPNQWTDITLTKKCETSTIEATINAGERIHVLLPGDISVKQQSTTQIIRSRLIRENHTPYSSSKEHKVKEPIICSDEFFVGGVPRELKTLLADEPTTFSGMFASISINSILVDLHEYNVESHKDNKVQVSSRTASVSGSYHETAWGKTNGLNLTCLHARTLHSQNEAHWLYLDTIIIDSVKDKEVRCNDDGRVLKLVASADNDLRGFYTCRSHLNRRTRNIVTYGVLGKVQYKLTGPDLTTTIALITTVSLVIFTLSWLVIEGINDLRDGYGFFRDANLTPEEEAEAVCRYIDHNIHLIGSESAAKIAKARARRKGRQLASHASFGAQEPQGMMQNEKDEPNLSDDSLPSELGGLPALPEINSNIIQSHDIYRCEPSYFSSPLHGSNITCRATKITSSSYDTSPRILCSKVLTSRHKNSTKENVISKRNKITRSDHLEQTKKKLLTIKSSTFVTMSPVQRVLQKFQKLSFNDH